MIIDYKQLGEAACFVDPLSEEDFQKVFAAIGGDQEGFINFAEQRALRALFLLVRKEPLDFQTPINLTEEEDKWMRIFMAIELDGLTIGIRAVQATMKESN